MQSKPLTDTDAKCSSYTAPTKQKKNKVLPGTTIKGEK